MPVRFSGLRACAIRPLATKATPTVTASAMPTHDQSSSGPGGDDPGSDGCLDREQREGKCQREAAQASNAARASPERSAFAMNPRAPDDSINPS